MNIELFFFVSLVATVACEAPRYEIYDYCDPNLNLCHESSSHTMCRYPRVGLSKDCMTDANEPLTVPEKFHVVHLHNKLRSKVASGQEKINYEPMPQASNMMELHWDEELEAIAMRWAEQCINVTASNIHDECRNTKRFPVSQNVATLDMKDHHSDKYIQNFLHKWHVKSKYLDPKTMDSFMSMEEHHLVEEYSNMIWAETYAIGCAKIIFRNQFSTVDAGIEESAGIRTFERLICNYGPAGNIPNHPIYKRGTPCSECPEETVCSSRFRGLCSFYEKVTSITSSVRTTENAQSTHEITDENLDSGLFTIPDSISMGTISPATEGTTFSRKEPPAEKITEIVDVSEREPEIVAVKMGINVRNKTLKIWAKTGIFYNGNCHCSDIIRSGNKKHERGQEQSSGKLPNAVGEEVEAGEHWQEMSLPKDGDKCRCIRFLSGGIARIVLSGMLHCASIIHSVRSLIRQFCSNGES